MKYLLGLLFCCLLVNLDAQERPDWVKQRPVSSMHYIGIACVAKSEQDYMQKAKQNALNDLISEIKVNVASTSLLHTLEESDRVTSKFEETIRVEAQESIENFKMRGSWQDDTAYWVYYELNKFDYEEMVEKRREKAIRDGFDCWWQGNTSQENGNLTIALAYYLKGLEVIRPVINEVLVCSVEGKDIDVGHELYNSLLNIFREIRIQTSPEILEGKAFQGIDTSVLIRVDRKGIPLKNVPLACEFISGSGQLSQKLVTNEVGEAKLYIRNITSKLPEQEVSVTLDKALFALLEKSVYHGLLNSVLRDMPRGQVNISIGKNQIRAYMNVEENADQTLKRTVAGLLTNNYFDLVESPAQADVLVLLKTGFRKGETVPGEMYDFMAYYTTVHLDVVNNHNNRVILHYGIDDMRNLVPAKNSLTAAKSTAMRDVIKRLQRELEKELKALNIDTDGDINQDPNRLKKKPEVNPTKPVVEIKPKSEAEKTEKKPVITKPDSTDLRYVEGELLPNLFIRYVGKKDYGDKTLLNLKVINKMKDDFNMDLFHRDIKVINEDGEEMEIVSMKLGSSENDFRVRATIIPEVETSFVLQVKKIKLAKLIQISVPKGIVKLRDLK